MSRCGCVAKSRLARSGCFLTVAGFAAAYTLSMQFGIQLDSTVVRVVQGEAALFQASAINATTTNCRIESIDRLPHSYAGGKYLRQQCKGPFGSAKPDDQRKLVILVRGESFRGLKGMYDRTVDVDNKSFGCQSEASESHVRYLIEPFESCGFRVDVILHTWKAHDKRWGKNSSQQMIDMYGGRVVDARFNEHRQWEAIGRVEAKINPQAMNYQNGLLMVAAYANRTGTSWDALLIVRSDLVFKKSFGNAKYERVLLAFKEWSLHAEEMVGDTIHWLPWRFLNCAVQDGFKEHFSTSLAGRVGAINFGFIEKERHDTNTMADWNPLYKMCRPEQLFNIDGGFALMMFTIRPQRKDKLEASGASVRHTLFLQGKPRALPPVDVVYHMWIRDKTPSDKFTDAAMDAFGMKPIAKEYEQYLGQDPSNSSGWATAVRSMQRVQYLLTHTAIFAQRKQRMAKVHSSFAFDRLVFARADYKFLTPFISIYACDTSRVLCVGFGASQFPTVPVVVVASQKACDMFASQSSTYQHLLDGLQPNVAMYLEKAFGMPVKVLCKTC